MDTKRLKIIALRAAFPFTLPICAGFLFLGFSYGFLMTDKGFPVYFPILISAFVYAGSMQFAAVSLLLSSFNPMYALLMTFMVNARHLFYGISMLGLFRNTGVKKYYLIFGMCDETFSLNYFSSPPEGVDRQWFMLFVTLLNHIYWILGTALGAFSGSILSFNTEGIDFALTALFVVIFLNQWDEAKQHLPACIGLYGSVICLILFGPDKFMVPSMFLIVLLLTAGRKKIEKTESST